MIKAIISDFSRVLLFLKEENPLIKLNDFHEKKLESGDYDFWQYFRLNEELLEFYRQLSEEIDLYIFTTRYIQEYPPLKEKLVKVFANIISAHQLGLKKDNPTAFQYLIKKTGFPPEQILYIDDKPANLKAAKGVGLNTFQYRNNQETITFLKEVFVKN